MNLLSIALATLIVGTTARAQDDLRPRLYPITSEIRRAGVFHVATGTWSREASFANLIGPDTIYNNTCSVAYFGAQIGNERWQHNSRLPSPTGPTTDSVFYGTSDVDHRWDERPGCRTSYEIDGFEFAYCSSKPSGSGTITYVHQFAHSSTTCAANMVPAVTITLTGLPGGSVTGGQICWVMDVDLDSTSESFVLRADGDGTYTGPSQSETFGWRFGPGPGVSAADLTGPMIAGNFTWTGGPTTGSQTPCTGTDGTIWDAPVDLSEPGTGMSSQISFRVSGVTDEGWGGTGCYFFGGTPHADFYLKLFAAPDCSNVDPNFAFCFPGQSGVILCPCNNPPIPPGLGCNNFGAGPIQSGTLSASGSPSIASDTCVLTAIGENNTSTTIFLQSPSSSSTGLIFGAGVRCLSGTLKRLYSGSAAGGGISRPAAGDPDIHTRSAALGDPLSAGATRFYMSYYRDPQASGPCSNAASTFNCSNSGRIVWQP